MCNEVFANVKRGFDWIGVHENGIIVVRYTPRDINIFEIQFLKRINLYIMTKDMFSLVIN